MDGNMDAFDKARKKFTEWETWAENVKPGDRVRAGGCDGVVTAVTGEYLWARVDGQPDSHPWEWEQVEPVDETDAVNAPTYVSLNEMTAGTFDVIEKALCELLKAVNGPDLLSAARQAVARIDKQADVIFCLKHRLSRYEEVG